MKIQYHGFWNSTGYGISAMSNVVALKHAGHQVNVSVLAEPESNVPKAEFRGTPDAVIMHVQPRMWPELRIQGALNIGYTTWEADRIPKDWLPWMHQADQVWVPSEWNKKVFEASGFKLPVHVIPHHVKKPLSNKQNSIDKKFRFYTIATAHVRKNLSGLLEAYKAIAAKFNDVELWIKISGEGTADYRKTFMNSGIWESTRWIEHRLTDEQISTLHKECDCFVSLNTGEGFGMPIADAIAHGNQVVTTGYGGQLDFCEGYAELANFKLASVSRVMEEHGFDSSMKDAKADIDHAVRLMVKAYHQKTISVNQRKLVSQHIQKHSTRNLGKLMDKALNDRAISLKFLDNGIGDMVCFLYAFEGFRQLHAAMDVNLLWKKGKENWYKTLLNQIDYQSSSTTGKTIEIHLNTNENFGKRIKDTRSYRKQYADHLYCQPALPKLKRKLREILIFPSAAWNDRIWPTENFGKLTKLLAGRGYSVIFCDTDKNRTPKGFDTKILPPERITELISKAPLVIANESGMAHLAGLLGTPCICISGYQPKWRAHDMNDVVVIQKQNLSSITPNEVFSTAMQILSGKPSIVTESTAKSKVTPFKPNRTEQPIKKGKSKYRPFKGLFLTTHKPTRNE